MSDFWVVTAYFNLAGSCARRDDYRCFRAALGAKLLCVEWHPDGRFELDAGDADVLLRRSGGDPMWQKERLLNMALDALPDTARYVAWLDCDLVFRDRSWIDETRALLDNHALVQPFAHVAYLDAARTRELRERGRAHADGAATRASFASVYQRVGRERIVAMDLATRFATSHAHGAYDVLARPAYGHAWAARRETAQRIGLYERGVMGAGDLMFAYGAIGHDAALVDNHRSVGWGFYGDCASYRDWSRAAHAASGGRCASGAGTVLHLHHGSLDDRQYRSRLDGLKPFEIDLDRDVAAAPDQPWSWTRDRRELSRYFMAYIANRREDD